MRTYQGFLSNAYEGKTKETGSMRTKFLFAAMFIAALMLMPTANALPTEASPGMHAAATTEDAMTYAAVSTAATTPMKPGATEVTRVDACEAGAAVALTTISAANIALNTNNENAAGHTVMKTTTITAGSGTFNGVFAGATLGTAFTTEVAFAAHEIAGAAIAFA